MNDVILQLGRDCNEWGRVTLELGGAGRTAVASSVGAHPDAPSMISKGRPDQPNEDAALAREEGSRTLIAVADAHHGIDASHDLIEALSRIPVPADFAELGHALLDIEPVPRKSQSSSTLLVAVVDREDGTGFGLSFGDSSLVRVGPQGAHVVNVRRAAFVHLRTHGGLDPDAAHGFRFFLEPGELVLAFTDGINECHYRSPATSVGKEHLEQLFAEHGARPERYAAALARLALDGVDGHPGGQDNLALVATATDPGPPA